MRLVLCGLAALACCLAPARAALVALETDATNLTVGDAFEVRLTFEAETEAEFLTAFLADVFVFGGVIEGAALTDQLDLPGGPFEGDAFVNLFGDFVQIFAVTTNTDEQLRADQADAFVVATLSLRATEAGLLTVTLGALREFTGASFGALDVTITTGRLELDVAAADPIPVPPAALMLGGALPLLRRVRR